ncbi:MAG: streptomycin biosynthesis protein StrI [Verrucomicrobia bacterium GWF2_62_7]|nr:MAG: streptomycin biosynthesis protein StrI [Verrucomicrobia bacterium GWF2_62_7]
MNHLMPSSTTRREFIKTSSRIAAASALAGTVIPRVHAASGDTVQLAIVGCGGRGTGAIMNALNTATLGPIKLVAMADAFEDKLKKSHDHLSKNQKTKTMVEVPEEKKFLGFDAYKKAMDCLKPGDVVILTTPPAFRWVHFTYAIQKGLNVFMEKPVTVDGPTSKRMLVLGEEASKKNLKVGVGLMSRHNKALQELAKRIHGGEIGEVILMRGYRMHGPVGYFSSLPKPEGISELRYQVQRFHSFLWASGGNFSDFYIHVIDHSCWMKNAWPVSAQALGGRHYRKSPEGIEYIDQNLDTYSVEYTFDDGTKFFYDGRCMNGCENIYNGYIHGSKGSAISSKHGDCGLPASIFKGQKPKPEDLVWESKVSKEEQSPYDNEWMDLIAAIRENKPYNEVERGVKASLVTSMGRMAAHTGQVITFDQILNGDHEFAPGLDKLTEDSPAPLQAGPDGKYPVPMPGINRKREYGV